MSVVSRQSSVVSGRSSVVRGPLEGVRSIGKKVKCLANVYRKHPSLRQATRPGGTTATGQMTINHCLLPTAFCLLRSAYCLLSPLWLLNPES